MVPKRLSNCVEALTNYVQQINTVHNSKYMYVHMYASYLINNHVQIVLNAIMNCILIVWEFIEDKVL